MNDPRDAEVDEANTRLAAGLKSCRSVVESYRAMLSGDHEEGTDGVASNRFVGFDPQEGIAP